MEYRMNRKLRYSASLDHETTNSLQIFEPGDKTFIKAGVHVKAVLTSLNSAFQPILISVTFQATLNLSAYLINHCLAVLCKFLGDFGAFWERDIFSQRIG